MFAYLEQLLRVEVIFCLPVERKAICVHSIKHSKLTDYKSDIYGRNYLESN